MAELEEPIRITPLSAWREDDDSVLPAWTWRHLSTDQQEKLKPKTAYLRLLYHSGLPGTTRSVLRYLADLADWRGHCYARLSVIADRTGWHRNTVKRALADAQARDWLIVDRRACATGGPADYWLDVPNPSLCPCGCEAADLGPERSEGGPEMSEGDTAEVRAPDQKEPTPTPERSENTWGTAPGGLHRGDSHVGEAHPCGDSESPLGDAEHREPNGQYVMDREERSESEVRKAQERNEREMLKGDLERWVKRLRAQGADERTIRQSCKQIAESRSGESPDPQALDDALGVA